MHLNKITLIAENIPLGLRSVTINYQGVNLTDFTAAQNNTFYYLEIEINRDARAGAIPVTFHFANNKTNSSVFYLYKRTENTCDSKLTAADAIYQIIPDRFCDSRPQNNQIKQYFEKPDRLNPGGIHGGDIEGIIKNIPYISELGCTSIELTPVLESNLMTHSYDRMGTTNHYKIDERLGSNSDYISLAEECNKNNIKLIQTFVLHQIGKQHPWYKKMIDPDFFYRSLYNYDDNTINFNILLDPYATEKAKADNREIWEQANWPTLNQNNPIVQKLIVQHCIWWMETSGLRIIKINQAARNTPDFLSSFAKKIKQEYPEMNLILDTKSTYNTYNQWQKYRAEVPVHYTDYAFPKLMSNAFSTYEKSNEGVHDLYSYAIKHDVKTDIASKIICLDNPFLSRAYTNADSESNQMLMMLGTLLTTPGIASIYYGTEWQLKGNYNKGVSTVRRDFPGGWATDAQNGFSQNQMSHDKITFYHQLKAILQWRKNNKEVLNGDFIHFYPQNDIYTFARISNNKALLVVINNSDHKSNLSLSAKYEEVISNYTRGLDIVSGARYMDYNEIIAPAKSITMLELRK